MNNHGSRNSHSRGSGRYQSVPDYTPLLGVKMYFSESGFLLTFIFIAVFALIHINMALVELSDSSSFACIAGLGAALLLAAGGLITLVSSYSKELPGIFIFSGLLLMFFSFVAFCVPVLLSLVSESSLFGVVQGMMQLFLLAGLIVMLGSLLISCLNRRTSPGSGYVPMVAAAFACALLVLRVISTFARLAPALGSSFSWDNTGDLYSDVRWVLRSLATTSPAASQMFYARLFERIALILLQLSALPPIFRFPEFFRQYNTQMDISAEMPSHKPQLNRPDQNPIAGDLLSGLSGLRGKHSEAEYVEPDPLEYDEYSDDEDEFYSSDYIYEERKEQPAYTEPAPTAPTEAELHETQHHVKYVTDALDPDYGKPIEEAPDSAVEKSPQKVTLHQKDSSGIPSPFSDDFWNNYED